MSTTTNSFTTGSLTFGSVPPTSTNQIDDDTHIVTSDGTSIGTPTALYKFDAETSAWVSIPLGGTACPSPMTRAALIALRTAGGLTKDCDYVVTDFVQGRLLAGTLIHFQAVDASTLSMNVEVKTLFDNVAWAGIYDIDADRFLELRDSIGNIVRDSTSTRVTAFDWGNPAYTRCYIEDSNVTYTYGLTLIVNGLRVVGSTASLTGRTAGQIFDVDVVASTFDFRATGASFLRTSITNQSNISIVGTPALSTINNTKISGSTLIIGNSTNQVATISFCSFGEQSVVNHTSPLATISIVSSSLSQSVIGHSGGSFSALGLQMRGGDLSQPLVGNGAISITRVAIESNASISVTGSNNVTLQNSSFTTGSTFTFGGTGTISITGSAISSGSSNAIPNGIAGTLTISNSTISNSTAISSTVAGNTSIDRSELTGSSTITRSGTGTLSIVSSKIHSNGVVSSQNIAGLSLSQSNISGGGQVVCNGTGATTNTLRQSIVDTSGRVIFGHTTAVASSFSYVRVKGINAVVQTSGVCGVCLMGEVDVFCSRIDITGANQKSIAYVIVANNSSVNLSSTINMSFARCRIENGSTLNSNQNAPLSGFMQQILLLNNSTYNLSGNSTCSNVFIYNESTFTQTGGSVNTVTKSMGGTLTSGVNQIGVYHNTSTNQTLTAININRGRDLFNNNLV